MQIAILGRQPKISLAELESLFGAQNITPVGEYAALIATDKPLPQTRLGGTMKSATVITRLKNADANQAFDYIQHEIVAYADEKVFDGKIQLGFSLYGYKAQKNWLLKKSLEVKKILKKAGRSVRIIENKAEALEAAQILYNKLTGPQGIELLIVKDGADVILAQTTAVQDIDAYAKRDFDRPKRDAFVGMLPPKLAQIMLNLAIGNQFLDLSSQNLEEADSKIQDLSSKIYALDPFCGTGVVLQEALLMGYAAYGTDLSEKMVDYTRENLQWLTEFVIPDSDRESSRSAIAKGDAKSDWILNQVQDDKPQWKLETADATTHTWDFSKIQDPRSKIYIVCETYLGKPLTSLPPRDELDRVMSEANQIAEGFLKNMAQQLEAGTRLCIALPAWHLGNSTFKHLNVLDHLADLGYNRLDLSHAKKEDLIYHREDQVVARELTILVRS